MKRELKLRRVVITGMGVVAPNGMDLSTFWTSVKEGRGAGAMVTRFDTSDVPGKVAAELKGFDPQTFIGLKKMRRMDLASQYAVAAAKLAVEDSGLDFMKVNRKRVGVVEGVSVGGYEGMMAAREDYESAGYKGVGFFALMNGYSGNVSGEVAQELGARGLAATVCSGSASGNDSIGYGLKMIQTGDVDVMIAGGAEAPLFKPIWAGFCKGGVMTQSEDPHRAMKPFDSNRDGFLLGEGSAFLVLEDLEHAMKRGAKIYAEVLGHGRSCEAYHSLTPHPQGVGVTEAIQSALANAGVDYEDVGYINAHGTATVLNDSAETLGIKNCFGAFASKIAVSSTKPVTGHLLGAAGAIESVICSMVLRDQEMPPTLNLSQPAEDCDLDYIPNTARSRDLDVVLNLNSGFGGKNSCLVLGRFQE